MMSNVSLSSDSPSASDSSPGDQDLAEEEETRMDESHKREISFSIDANEQVSAEDLVDNALSVASSSPRLEHENKAESGPGPEIEAESQAQSGSQLEPQPEPQPDPGSQSQIAPNRKENGTAGQPYSIDDDNTVRRNDTTAPSGDSRTPAAPSTNGQLQPDKVTDGRVRQNPVPNKYVAKATKRDGSFGVMQMGHGRAFMDARDLAAKRSSEATQAAAEEAIRNGHNGIARRKHVWKPADPDRAAPPPPQQYTQHQQQGSKPYPQTAYYPPPANRAMGPSPNETKNEQARLLTFLRSLHPVIVVDQLCKALAYFGGIPGAPAPQDPSVFPSSDKGNGQGGLLVGWLAEIFPPADFTKPPFTDFPHSLPNMGYVGPTGQALRATHDLPGPEKDTLVKRPRGRPKGSKNSKFRKDKGAKKLKSGEVPPRPDGTPWRPGDESTTVDLTQDTNSSQQAQPLDNATNQTAIPLPPADNTPAKASQADPDSSVATTPGSRKRGRPKGSKSRPKPVPAPNLPVHAGTGAAAPGVQESPLASVARAARNATSTQYQSPYEATPAQRNPSAQEPTLSQHAQGWTDPPLSSPREAVAGPPRVLSPGAANEDPNTNNSRKRKQQHALSDLPAPLSRETQPVAQPEEVPQQGQSERHQLSETNEATQAKRRRTASAARPATIASSTNSQSQSQSPVLSTSIASNNVTSASFGGQGVASRAPTMRPSSGQMTQQHYQASSQQQQYQHQQQGLSPPLQNAAQNNMQSRQGSNSQQLQQSYQQQRQGQQQQQQQEQQQPYTPTSYQNATTNHNLSGTAGAINGQRFSHDHENMDPTQYALSARRAMEDTSAFGNQSMYGQFGRR